MPTLTPEIIHFIWIGKDIPPKYLESIRKLQLLLATNKEHSIQIQLWTDKPEHIYNSADDIPKDFFSRLEVKTISADLLPPMQLDPFYTQDAEAQNRLMLFNLLTSIESIGSENFATVSDLLRLEILRQFGGCYMDTDTTFEENFSQDAIQEPQPFVFTPEELPLGFKGYSECKFQCHNGEVLFGRLELAGAGNDIMLATANSELVNNAITNLLDKFKKMLQAGFTKDPGKKFLTATYDLKRSKLETYEIFRRMGSIAFGPDTIGKTMQMFFINQLKKVTTNNLTVPMSEFRQMQADLLLTVYSHRIRIFGIIATSHSDQNWLKKDGGRPRSHSNDF
jgi:hypothetical protein